VPDTEGEPLGGEDLVKLVQLVRRALWGEGERPEIRVEGVDASGLMSISIISPEVVYRIKAPDLSALVALAGPRQQPPREPDRSRWCWRARTPSTWRPSTR
jgi:hypothetical protein